MTFLVAFGPENLDQEVSLAFHSVGEYLLPPTERCLLDHLYVQRTTGVQEHLGVAEETLVALVSAWPIGGPFDKEDGNPVE